MAARFVNIDRDTPLLLPPDLREWVPEDHLVHFVLDAVGELELSAVRVNERGTGDAQYPPALLLALLIYSYASGVFSSRAIERSSFENVAVRLLCADTHPDHDTICTFRRQNAALLARSFAQVVELAARCGVLKVGGITVAIDGTKVLASASKHAAVSYGHAGETMQRLDLEIEALLAKAEQADRVPLAEGLSIPRGDPAPPGAQEQTCPGPRRDGSPRAGAASRRASRTRGEGDGTPGAADRRQKAARQGSRTSAHGSRGEAPV